MFTDLLSLKGNRNHRTGGTQMPAGLLRPRAPMCCATSKYNCRDVASAGSGTVLTLEGDGLFHDPAVDAEAGAVVASAADKAGGDGAELAAIFVVVAGGSA